MIRRSYAAEQEWLQRHWFAYMLSSAVGLTAIFIYFAVRYGFEWGTIFFGVVAGLGYVLLVMRLVFRDFWRPR